MIKVILQKEVKGQGKRGDIVEVSEGFARNYLIPRGNAIIATPKEIQKIQEEKKKVSESLVKEDERNKASKDKIERLTILVSKKAKDGKLFGAISPHDVTGKLKEKNINIQPKQVVFKNPIKETGKFNVIIELGKNIVADLKIEVRGE